MTTFLVRALLVAATAVVSVLFAGNVAKALVCEQAFAASDMHARWRSASRDQYVIDQTDRLLRREFEDRLPSAVYESVRVEDYSLLRFEAERISLLELSERGRKTPVAQFRIFSAGEVGRTLQVLSFFEVIHKEASSTREWRKFSSVTMTNRGFSSTLSSWRSLYGPNPLSGKIFEVSRLEASAQHALYLRRELETHKKLNPEAIYFAFAKTDEQAGKYRDIFGFRIIEEFTNPRTGAREFILSSLNTRNET